MAIGIPEQGGGAFLNDDERLIIEQELHLSSEGVSLQTTQLAEPTSVEEELAVSAIEPHLAVAPEISTSDEVVPVEDEQQAELSQVQLWIKEQKTEYDPGVAELLIDEMQNDKELRHRKGLDAKDIAEAHGIHDSVVRRTYSVLLRHGKLKDLPKPLTRTRENGQQSAHYPPKVLYLLLPAVAEEAVKEHQNNPDV